MKAESEEGVQRDNQDFRCPVQRSHCIVDSRLGVESGLVGIGCEKGHAGFLEDNSQLLTIGPPHQYGAGLVGPRLGLHNAGNRSQQSEVVGVGRHVYVGNWAV